MYTGIIDQVSDWLGRKCLSFCYIVHSAGTAQEANGQVGVMTRVSGLFSWRDVKILESFFYVIFICKVTRGS